MYAVTFALFSSRRNRISKVSSGEYKNTLRTDYVNLKYIDCDFFNSLTVLHLSSYFRLLAFLLLNVANKITDKNPLKAKLSIFIEEPVATSVESLWNGAIDHESLKTTVLKHKVTKSK